MNEIKTGDDDEAENEKLFISIEELRREKVNELTGISFPFADILSKPIGHQITLIKSIGLITETMIDYLTSSAKPYKIILSYESFVNNLWRKNR